MSLKLPDGYLREFLRAQDCERTAFIHLGALVQEYKQHEARLLERLALEHANQDAVVKAGLRALSLDPDSTEHHYAVEPDGSVAELIDGKHVPLPGR